MHSDRNYAEHFYQSFGMCLKQIFSILIFVLLAAGCIQKFQPKISSPVTGYLVVEGQLNSGGGPAHATLSRTTMLGDTTRRYEVGAIVNVEGDDNSSYPLTSQGNGTYGISDLLLNSGHSYRLEIKTSDGEEYLSDYSVPKTCPPIDSVSWSQTTNGLQISVSTHDPQNNTIYYLWNYEETWEFHSPFFSDLYYDTVGYANNVPIIGIGVAQDVNYDMLTCWRTNASSGILIGSSAALGQDVIANAPIATIPSGSSELAVEYSILVNQFAMTADEYAFMQLMKKNTEETGSIFGLQPTHLQGNIHSISNPAELVVGFVGFSSVQQKRIFIYDYQVANWVIIDNSGCTETIFQNNSDQIATAFANGFLPTLPVLPMPGNPNTTGFYAAPARCVDCRLSGSNQRPAFWQ